MALSLLQGCLDIIRSSWACEKESWLTVITPFLPGVTPCISPVRELDANILSKHMWQHSDVEIIEVSSEEGEDSVEGFSPPDFGDLETDFAGQAQDSRHLCYL